MSPSIRRRSTRSLQARSYPDEALQFRFGVARDDAILLRVSDQSIARVTSATLERTEEGELSDTDTLRALSIRQPWAHAILYLRKNVENRPWLTHRRGRILIQASQKVEREEARKLRLDLDKLVTGAILGDVEITDCVQDSKSAWAIRGQWHWILKNPRFLQKPIPFKGALGFIEVSPKLLKGARFKKG